MFFLKQIKLVLYVRQGFCWYDAADSQGITNYSIVAPMGVGYGKTNTETMIAAWKAETYGDKNVNIYGDEDLWGAVIDGWYVPSKDEWAAFGDAFNITSSNYSSTWGLRNSYWSSSLNNSNSAWLIDFGDGYLNSNSLGSSSCYVRLGTTF